MKVYCNVFHSLSDKIIDFSLPIEKETAARKFIYYCSSKLLHEYMLRETFNKLCINSFAANFLKNLFFECYINSQCKASTSFTISLKSLFIVWFQWKFSNNENRTFLFRLSYKLLCYHCVALRIIMHDPEQQSINLSTDNIPLVGCYVTVWGQWQQKSLTQNRYSKLCFKIFILEGRKRINGCQH